MTLKNRDVLAIDPTHQEIPNLGVAKVRNPQNSGEWSTLEWELRSFVCEGEYARGLERILDQFLSHLAQAEQPAVWVSGFYGSGKSHLMRVLARQVQRIIKNHGLDAHPRTKIGGRERRNQDFVSIFRPLVEQLLVDHRGLDPFTCGECGERQTRKCDIHHTKYEGATLFDLMFVCRTCNLAPRNKGLL